MKTSDAVRSVAPALLLLAIITVLWGCAASKPAADNAPSGTGGTLAQPNPAAPAEPARGAVEDLNEHTDSVDDQQPAGSEAP